MKKAVGISLLACGLLLAGCGNETSKETTSKQIQEDTKKGTGEIPKPVELKVTVEDQAAYAYTDPDIDTNEVTFHAVLKNESKDPVDVNDLTVTYLDKEDKVIPADPTTVYVSPQVVEPGGKAYVSTATDMNTTTPDQFGKAELKITPQPTAQKVKDLPVTNYTGTFDGTRAAIDGKTKNNTKISSDYITIGGAIYTMDDKFIGTVYGQVDGTLNAGQESGFHSNSEYIPAAKVPEKFKYEVYSSTYEDMEGTAGEGGDGEVTE